MKIASFKVSKKDSKLISRILVRIKEVCAQLEADYPLLEAEMDLCACHANGMEMDFTKLLYAPLETFAHDVFGIRKHINRTSGEIEGCFVPRCAIH